jgi:hypothetical protein
LEGLVLNGSAIDVSQHARRYFTKGRVAIAASVYDQHIAWPSSAVREHCIHLDELERLDQMLRGASGAVHHDSPAEFVHRGLAADAPSTSNSRHTLVLQRLLDTRFDAWLIRH